MGVRHRFRKPTAYCRLHIRSIAIPAQDQDDGKAMVNLDKYSFYIYTFSQK